MRQLSLVLLLAVAAYAAADAGFSQYNNQYDSAPSGGVYNYQPRPQPSGLNRIWNKLTAGLTPNRRQFGDGLGLPGFGITIFLLFGGVILAVIAVGALGAALSSSGRGLDTDEWEVDHSVWMDQLERDFEDSWSVQ